MGATCRSAYTAMMPHADGLFAASSFSTRVGFHASDQTRAASAKQLCALCSQPLHEVPSPISHLSSARQLTIVEKAEEVMKRNHGRNTHDERARRGSFTHLAGSARWARRVNTRPDHRDLCPEYRADRPKCGHALLRRPAIPHLRKLNAECEDDGDSLDFMNLVLEHCPLNRHWDVFLMRFLTCMCMHTLKFSPRNSQYFRWHVSEQVPLQLNAGPKYYPVIRSSRRGQSKSARAA